MRFSKTELRRNKDLQLTEHILIGAVLATFIASLSVCYRMSRTKIREFLKDWSNTELRSELYDKLL